MPSFETVVFREGWPSDGLEALRGFDTVVVYCDGGGGHLLNSHIDEFDTLMDQGVGLVCLHYGVETPKGKTGDAFLEWLGGYFETHYSVNPHWDADFKSFPDHPISNGVKPFKINDEWYFHMRFRPEMKNVTPILSAHPPKSTMSRGDGPHSGNPHVRAAMARGDIQHVAWAAEREGNGRGFGFTGGHFHWNWGDANFRKVVLNAIAWTAHTDVPENGVGGEDPTRAQLEENQDYPKPGEKKQEAAAVKPDGAIFESKVVTTKTPGYSVDIKADIKGAKKLYLVIADGGNGFSCDWADWVDPKLVGDSGEKKLTDLKWESASSAWGSVQVNKNASGGPLRVNGESVAGIGSHANSVIEFDVPPGYSQFVAKGGLDDGGTHQQDGNATSVQFLVYTTKPATIVTSSGPVEGSHDPEQAVANMDVHPELKATRFASEPLLLSPSNIDIDDRGRVWVCEIVNYRGHKGKRPEGDRILILEDTDGNGTADDVKVFYQGQDIDSPHGVCVLGNRVIVSSGENVIVFTDTDGDDKADEKETVFTGISGAQHDHGIHKFMFGPDGKLYFNFGNAGKQLKDPKTGDFIVDSAGNQIRDSRQPYQHGMVFRCNMDFRNVETLGWNFRNNWMITVDSFGTLWQSDNDDDGNTGVRINYVMEFGDYGYCDSRTGAGWRSPRTGMHSQRALRHWHQNDPGIVPNLLHTGAGSPTGIMVYEGSLLPKIFHGQVVHCDAGPSVVRAYPVKDSGAGYTASIVNILEGTRDRWFRPSDVQAAPDGSLIVADWYDPGVGGHAMGDLDRGRLFRVVPKDHDGSYKVAKFDYDSVEGAVAALQNPNNAVRFRAWTSLHNMGEKAEAALTKLWQSDDARMRARALWLLGKIEGRGQHYVDVAIGDSDSNIRIAGLRLARQLSDVSNIETVEKLVDDSSPQVRRECAVALRHETHDLKPTLWAKLASQHDGNDRWYLEALGIGAELDWNRCIAAWRATVGDKSKSGKAANDIIWRSRAKDTPSMLAEIITNSETPNSQLPRYFRAFDFLDGEQKDIAIATIAFSSGSDDKARGELLAKESFERLRDNSIQTDDQRKALNAALDAMQGTENFVKLVERFSVVDRYGELLGLAQKEPSSPTGIAAVRALLEKQQARILSSAIQSTDEASQNTVVALGNSADNRAADVLASLVYNGEGDLEMRRQALRSMARVRSGALRLLKDVEEKKLDERLVDVAAMAFHSAPFGDIRRKASEIFPAPQAKGEGSLPPARDLARLRGDGNNGAAVFAKTGTCANCHVVGGKGKEVGPDLSQIGSKLSREAMFESIIYPGAGVAHNYENFTAVLSDGNVITGLVTSKTDDQVVMKDAEGIQRTIDTADIEQLTQLPISLMPNDISKLMTKQELVDVVEYLTTLKK
ncbi:MAG: NPCBM/NEW2 domain-containing protein [Planctomycetales bacterium]|nr:NPCBM/NEW2 domain-containing protein [Planctomycetales bacterium]